MKGSAVEFLPGVHQVPGVGWSRVYLLEDKTLTVIDSGPPWGARRVLDYIRSIGRRPDELELILLTHSHPDHVAGASALTDRTGARVAAHRDDVADNSSGGMTLARWGWLSGPRSALPFAKDTPVDEALKDGQLLPILGGLRVIHTPGHTPGSASFMLERAGVLFTGDTAFSDGVRVSRSVPFPGYDGEAYRRSLDRLASMEFEALCGGHGAPLVGGAAEELRQLLSTRPDPPTWGGFIKSVPKRLLRARGLTGEDGWG